MVSIVAEMTGYPPDLLDLDLDLEADLGVDTVKQAEVFAAVRARFGVERDDSLSLREFPTLTHVIGWILDKTAQPAAAPAAAPAATAGAAAPCRCLRDFGCSSCRDGCTCCLAPRLSRLWRRLHRLLRLYLRLRHRPLRPHRGGVWAGPSSDEVADAVVSIVAEMTGYPPDLLDLDLDLEADLGVDTVKQAEVFAAVRARFGVERDDSLSLREFPTLTHVIGWILDKTAQPAAAPAAPGTASVDGAAVTTAAAAAPAATAAAPAAPVVPVATAAPAAPAALRLARLLRLRPHRLWRVRRRMRWRMRWCRSWRR